MSASAVVMAEHVLPLVSAVGAHGIRSRIGKSATEPGSVPLLSRSVRRSWVTASSDPVRETNLSELQRRLNEAMQKLSPDHRAVVTMFDIQGMPHAEISKILGVSEGTVRSRLFYAHRQLQNYLEEFRQ